MTLNLKHSEMEEGILVGIGNPLLDLTVNGTVDLLQKYQLEADNAVLANEFQKPIYKELLDGYDVQYTAGGSVQNSLRVCQWILKKPKVCVFMGAVGKDKYSQILEKQAKTDGLEVRYQYQPGGIPTGTCAVIITTHLGNKRSLCANLAAAEKFTVDHITTPENLKIVEKAEVFYISGFFLTVSMETVIKIGEQASSKNKIFLTNLSAPFICKYFKESLMKAISFADIVVGNETEALTFAEEQNFNTKNLTEIAIKMANLPKENKSRSRVVIITQGCDPVLCAREDTVEEIQVPVIPKNQIIDTNGAGDAFVGGFLSQLVLGKSIKKCVECGIWAAGHVIQHFGCTFDKDVEFAW